jgi:hypothetical protein
MIFLLELSLKLNYKYISHKIKHTQLSILVFDESYENMVYTTADI